MTIIKKIQLKHEQTFCHFTNNYISNTQTRSPVSGLQRGRVQTLAGLQLQLSAVQALQLGHGAQVGLLQLLQLAVVLLVGEEDLTEVQAVRSVSAHQQGVAPPATLAVAELRA